MGPELNKWLFRKVFLLSRYPNKVTAKGIPEGGGSPDLPRGEVEVT